MQSDLILGGDGRGASGNADGLVDTFQLLEYQWGEGRFDINKLPAPPPCVQFMTEVTSIGGNSVLFQRKLKCAARSAETR